jgi:poly(3-hydroxyalkanoate) synthetase
MKDLLPPPQFFLWPFIAASEAVAAQAEGIAQIMAAACPEPASGVAKPEWTTPNRVRLDLATMELRDFSTAGDGVATLICAPFALHGATVADFATGHSLVQTLAHHGCRRLFVTDWRSATKDMRLLTIDNYLAELNVAVEEIGAPVDLVGLCQGGVMALIYAARFPAKVRKLVLAGAPIDIDAASSLLSITAKSLPLGMFDEVARLGEGRVQGQRVIELWSPALSAADALAGLQLGPRAREEQPALLERFRAWFDWTVDLPGAYYHQTVLWLFKENRLAEGRFQALGRAVDLADVRHPLFLLAAEDDELVAPEQLMAVCHRVGTKPADIQNARLPGSHLSLFIGARTLADGWSKVAQWLAQSCSTHVPGALQSGSGPSETLPIGGGVTGAPERAASRTA